MIRLLIFGNSGSGKSTLARSYSKHFGIAHLDLDEIAWEAAGVRKGLEASIGELKEFVSTNVEWVIEGCYGSLISEATTWAREMIFLNPGIEDCQENCQSRPWEPHKYESKETQDKNLEMLLKWVSEYTSRSDEFSYSAHKAIYDTFNGKKAELRSNAEIREKVSRVLEGRN